MSSNPTQQEEVDAKLDEIWSRLYADTHGGTTITEDCLDNEPDAFSFIEARLALRTLLIEAEKKGWAKGWHKRAEWEDGGALQALKDKEKSQ